MHVHVFDPPTAVCVVLSIQKHDYVRSGEMLLKKRVCDFIERRKRCVRDSVKVIIATEAAQPWDEIV